MVNKQVSRPKALICYICGRQYGTTSLKIHLKTCQKQWEIEQQKKPPKERKPVPQAPSNFDDMLINASSGTGQAVQQYNEEAFVNYNDNMD